MEQRLRGIDRTASGAGGRDSFGTLTRGAAAAEGKIGSLIGVVGRLGVALGIATAGMAVFRETARLETQIKSIEVLTGSLEQTKVIIAELKAFGAVTPFTSAELIDVSKRLAAFGVETSKVVETTKRLGDLAGATGANIGEIALAYGQVMSKGRVQTEELLQFQERGIGVQVELQKMYGLSGAEMQKAISAGRVPAEALEVAILRLTDAGGKYANGAVAQSATLQGKLSTLQDSVQTLAQTIGTALTPAFKWALDEATKVVSQIQRMLDLANNANGQAREIEWQRGADAYAERVVPNPFNTGGREEARRMFLDGRRADYNLSQQVPKPTAAPGASGAPRAIPALTQGTSGLAAGGGGSGGRRTASGGGQPFPAYITANQMRAWLKSQGYERTSGDFTNRGHRTPNHMLNAIDIGELDGSYPHAVQRAKALEGRLRATGAFGGQLFGPTSDPRGHKDHVHIPTPGGRIRVTPGLARLMGLGGGGSDNLAERQAEWANEAAEKEAERQKLREDGLRTSGRQLALSQADLKISQAGTTEQKIRATADRERTDRMYRFADLMKNAQTEEERINIARAQGLEIQKQQVEITKSLGDALVDVARKQEAAMRPRLDNIERLEATLKGPDAVRSLERRNAIGEMSAAGVDPAKAGELFDREKALERQIARQQELNALWEEGGRTLGGLFADLVRGTDDWQASLTRALESLASVLLKAGLSSLAEGNQGGFFGGLLNSLIGSFDGGGYTGSGSRTGGLDGKGGFAAILHPNETVIDHTKGQGLGGGSVTNNINVSVSTDGSTKVDGAGGGELARGIQAAVTAEILRQRRPGGVLAGA
jgi:tape measure domain-containing protein